jgi:hypothetical protein
VRDRHLTLSGRQRPVSCLPGVVNSDGEAGQRRWRPGQRSSGLHLVG